MSERVQRAIDEALAAEAVARYHELYVKLPPAPPFPFQPLDRTRSGRELDREE